jgi:putative nucleotidyltransferase with HDIG domain
MKEILKRFNRRKMEEALGQLSAGFGVSLALVDAGGDPLVTCGTHCSGMECLKGYECRSGRSAGSEPVYFMGQCIGRIVACSSPETVGQLTSGIARCLENLLKLETEIEDLSSEIVHGYEELSLISTISAKLGSEMDVDTVCRLVVEEADRVLAARTTFIMLLDTEQNDLATRFSLGRDRVAAGGFRADITSGLIGHVFRQGEPVTVCDIDADGRISLPWPVKSILCVPLIADAKPLGMLIVTDKLSGEEFWSPELKLMGIFASEVASSLRKAYLYEVINKLFLSTVEALATAIDAKDPYTYGHSRRVARISVAICAELGMAKERIRSVELASFLHDIGKIGTPESILQKPGSLLPEEYEKIKEHPAKGAEILSTIDEFREIVTWIRHHHEWFDGKGYPDRIAEEEIPLEARVITIADAFDAMTTDRPYRKGMQPDTVLKIMEQFARVQFDPRILGAFARCVEQGIIS